MPRNKDPVWIHFDCITTKNSGLWARCKKCKKEMQGILDRMKKHISICQLDSVRDTTTVLPVQLDSFSSPAVSSVIEDDALSSTCSDTSESKKSKGIVVETKMEIVMLKKRIIEQEYKYNKLMYEHRLKMNELELQQNLLRLELLQREIYPDDDFLEN